MRAVKQIFLASLLLSVIATPTWAITPAVVGGSHHSLLLKSDGSLWGWGDNFTGNVGDGTTIARNTPVKVLLNISATAIAAGPLSSFAIGSDSYLYVWGNNDQNQLGVNNLNSTPWPTKTLLTPASITSGGNLFSVEALLDGSVYSFGLNLYGELGHGVISTNTTPNPNSGGVVPSLSNITVVSSGSCHTIALRSDGTVWSWGCNSSGQLGDGTTTDRETPAQISGLSNVTAIAAGGEYSIAIRNDGTVWTWGYNAAQTVIPTQLPGIVSAKAAAVGGDGNTTHHAFILKTDGTVWAWGNNSDGAIGDGTTTTRTTPVQVLSGVISIGTGAYHSLAIKSDGSVWTWGTNTSGELGLGLPLAFHPTPTKIQNFYAIPPIAPTNDNFVNRTTISGLTGNISGTLAGATREAGEPLEGGSSTSKSIWYKWVAPAAGQVTLSAGGGPNTYVAAYSGSSVNSLAQISNGTLPFIAKAGVEYEIVIYDTTGAFYDTTLNWSLNTTASADISVSGSGNVSGTTLGLAYYNLLVANAGPNIVTNIVLTDTLPSSATFVPSINSPNCSLLAGQVICSIASIASGASSPVQITLQFANSQTVPSNTLSVSSDVPDPNLSNNSLSIVASPYIATTNGDENDVPTLPEWAAIILGMLLFASAAYNTARNNNV